MKSPDQVSDLLVWTHRKAATLSGSTVTALDDVSGNGASIVVSGTPQVSGNEIVCTAGNLDMFHIVSTGVGTGSPAFTVVARLKPVSTSARVWQLGSDSNATGGLFVSYRGESSTRMQDGSKQWFDDTLSTSAMNSIALSKSAGGTYDTPSFYLAGSLAIATTAGNSNTYNWAGDLFQIGGAGGIGVGKSNASVSFTELAIYNRVLTAQEIANLHSYMDAELFKSLIEPGSIEKAVSRATDRASS